jgi:hypothetical protein
MDKVEGESSGAMPRSRALRPRDEPEHSRRGRPRSLNRKAPVHRGSANNPCHPRRARAGHGRDRRSPGESAGRRTEARGRLRDHLAARQADEAL